MNNKGFTMIELIMVIMIIALLALLSAPNIIKMINRNKRENYNDTIDLKLSKPSSFKGKA